MRTIRSIALGALLPALLVSACSAGGSSAPSSAASAAPPAATSAATPVANAAATPAVTAAASSAATAPAGTAPAASSPAASTSGTTIASSLVLGGPPECPQRPFCAVGLQKTYGLTFKEFKPLDAGGPITVQAVKGGQVDVGLLFTSDPAIAVNSFVLLKDDKGLQLADNLVPVIRQQVLDANPGIAGILNPWMAKLTQDQLTALHKQVSVDQVEPAKAVKAWLAANGLTTGTSGTGKTVVVGSTNFYEQEILGELFSQLLEANGFTVTRKFNLGNREVVYPALKSGQIDLLAEYAATLLEYVNKSAGEATTDAAATVAKLKTRLAADGLTALDPAPATDQNGFVVTQATATKYGLSSLSDLAKPAP